MNTNARLVVSVCAAAGLAMTALAQESKPKQPVTPKPADTKAPAHAPAAAQPVDPTKMTPEDMMKAWEAANPITPEATKLAMDLAGEWNAECVCTMFPGATPNKSNGKAKFLAVNGMQMRFVSQEFQGEFLGKKFNGMGYMGWNPTTSKYESVWFDSTTNGFMFQTGTKDGSGAIDWTGTITDPMTKQTKKTHSKTIFKDHNTMTFEMFDVDEQGKEFKCMEISYTRVTAAKEVPAKAPEKTETPKTVK
jgi:hypothetical protein